MASSGVVEMSTTSDSGDSSRASNWLRSKLAGMYRCGRSVRRRQISSSGPCRCANRTSPRPAARISRYLLFSAEQAGRDGEAFALFGVAVVLGVAVSWAAEALVRRKAGVA